MSKMTLGEAIEKLRNEAGTHAKPSLVEYLDDLSILCKQIKVSASGLPDTELSELNTIRVVLDGIYDSAQILGIGWYELQYKEPC